MTKEESLHRLKIARGHLDKVVEMVTNDEYCIDIVHQTLAVIAALKKSNQLILEKHLRNCVSEEIKKGNSKKAIDEVMAVMEKS